MLIHVFVTKKLSLPQRYDKLDVHDGIQVQLGLVDVSSSMSKDDG